MRFTAIATVLLLPLAAVAEDQVTTTCTTYLTLTQTVTLKRVATNTQTVANSTASYKATGTSGLGSLSTTATTTSSSSSSTVSSAGSASGPVNGAAMALAGMLVVALM